MNGKSGTVSSFDMLRRWWHIPVAGLYDVTADGEGSDVSPQKQ